MSSLQPFMGLSYEPRNLFRGGQATKQKSFQGVEFVPFTHSPTASWGLGTPRQDSYHLFLNLDFR
jgi:hypothetical protein